MTEFVPFPKIPRLRREIVITEKIDGTNASIFIGEDGTFLVGSRTRWITPESDNFGFARWAHEHREELLQLGPGHHFGEWFGSGIQRGYGLLNGEKRFALFNVDRWADGRAPRPACCGVVPTLSHGSFADIPAILETLRAGGSLAVPGFMRPEGIVVYHRAARQMFKVTLDGDDAPKGQS